MDMQMGDIVNAMDPADRPHGRRAIRLAVVEVEGSWRILVDGRRLGRFHLQANAVQCALEIAGETRRDGWPVEVLTQQAFGELSVLQASSQTTQ